MKSPIPPVPRVRGRIKSGEGTLIGNAGEYYVVAELLKRGIIAALAPRNTPAFDILATKGEATVRIRVKTKSEQYREWQWMTKKDGAIFRHLCERNDFVVLVDLAMDTKNLNFYVVPTRTVCDWLADDFQKWLATPGKKGPHDPTNKKRNLNQDVHADQLTAFRNQWDILWI